MKVSELVPVDHISVGWPVRDEPETRNKWNLIQATVQFLCTKNAYSDDICRQISEKVCDRERVKTTAIGHGFAMPHASLSSIHKPTGACVVLQDGLDFESLDNKPVHIIILALFPDKDYSNHIAMLSRIVTLTGHHANCENILKLGSPEMIWKEISHLEV
ncbi:MAG: PTS sugar transporter subunit IIA [Spirochaetia bacterium]|nr:PTS sugar transporter subunit IIA [Spirochaetia bacterium]